MTRTRRHILRASLRHRLGVAVALFAYLAAAVGFPLPASPSARKDLSQPFPCQDNPCGCQNAEQCWSGCCCLSPEERWAWAEAHHVQPPEYAEKPGAAGWRTARLHDHDSQCESHAGCCEHESDEPKSCCSQGASHSSCCAHKHSVESPGDALATKSRPGTRWAFGMSSLRCKGLTTMWVGGGAVLPLSTVLCRVQPPALPERLAHRDLAADRVSRTPPAPPPRPFPV
jgi:hypothetical protein